MTKAKKYIIAALSIIAWLIIWEIGARIIDNRAFFSGAIDTFKAWCTLIIELEFWKTVLFTIFRIFIGFVSGVVIGSLIAFFTIKFKALYSFFAIGMGVIKSTPVASIIMIVWLFAGSSSVPSIISIFMVAPIVWQNLVDGYNSISIELDEVATVFEISGARRFKIVVLPAMLRFFVPATLTSVGLAWKAGVAAEIIAVAKKSIGYYIKINKDYFESDKMLAWTLTVIIISLLFEYGIKYLIKRYEAYDH